MQDARWVGAVLLSINCENGTGLAIEAHPLSIAMSDLIPQCRPRGLAPWPDLSERHSQHPSSRLLVLLRAYASSAVPVPSSERPSRCTTSARVHTLAGLSLGL